MTATTLTSTNVDLARQFLLGHNQPNYLAVHEATLAPDAIVHEYLPGLPSSLDRAGYAQFIAMFRASLPDVQNTILEVIDAGDRVVIRWTGSGTHTGEPLIGIPAAGKPVQAHGIYILCFAGGRIAEVWNHWDNLNVVQQLGGM